MCSSKPIGKFGSEEVKRRYVKRGRITVKPHKAGNVYGNGTTAVVKTHATTHTLHNVEHEGKYHAKRKTTIQSTRRR